MSEDLASFEVPDFALGDDDLAPEEADLLLPLLLSEEPPADDEPDDRASEELTPVVEPIVEPAPVVEDGLPPEELLPDIFKSVLEELP
ncbi:hypothetical protein FVR03_20960 [Pontibacter qinzhouensis]|uniref:Uncharacterized protein n=1 Tax=Pontibacter qinzhouensis TaxID=2603253 RepID=A0A5C8J2E6_9BACT|nr:hypothetical protein [Pontibacter qinzhouensis]TXK28260.1 hypothetical protein FVR03_20960 [Pontibacter qinzhouensis]